MASIATEHVDFCSSLAQAQGTIWPFVAWVASGHASIWAKNNPSYVQGDAEKCIVYKQFLVADISTTKRENKIKGLILGKEGRKSVAWMQAYPPSTKSTV
jgi:hypothetical protein